MLKCEVLLVTDLVSNALASDLCDRVLIRLADVCESRTMMQWFHWWIKLIKIQTANSPTVSQSSTSTRLHSTGTGLCQCGLYIVSVSFPKSQTPFSGFVLDKCQTNPYVVTTSLRHYLRHNLRQIRWWSTIVVDEHPEVENGG